MMWILLAIYFIIGFKISKPEHIKWWGVTYSEGFVTIPVVWPIFISFLIFWPLLWLIDKHTRR